MNFSIQTNNKIVQKTSPVIDKVDETGEIIENDNSVLSVGDFGTFTIWTDKKHHVAQTMVEGRIAQICREDYKSTEPVFNDSGHQIGINEVDKVNYIFVVDISEEFNSNTVEVRSEVIINWTKAGRETMLWEEVLNCMYNNDKYLLVEDDGDIRYLREGEIVLVTDDRFPERGVKRGMVKSITDDQMVIDFSQPSVSDIVVYGPESFDYINIDIEE